MRCAPPALIAVPTAALIAVLGALHAPDAAASGFDAPTLGSAQSGPVANDAAATWWNPGRLTEADAIELQVGLGAIFGAIGYQRDIRSPHQYQDNLDFAAPVAQSDLDPDRFGKQQKVRALPVGPAFDAYVAIPAIRDRLVFGLGVGIPYVAVVNFPEQGPQRFAGQSILLATPHATLAAAVKLHRVISIGAGISYVMGTLALSKVQDFGEVDTLGDGLERPPIGQSNDFGSDAPPEVRELDVMARPVEIRSAFAHGVSFNAGVSLQPTPKLAIGLVYHHGARMDFRGKFRLDMNDDFFTQDLAAQGLQYPAFVRGDARVRMRLPKRITVGIGGQVTPRIALDGFVSYVTYQDFDRIDIRFSSPDLAQPALGIGDAVDQVLVRNWKGAVAVEVSTRISATKKLLVSVTGGYNSPASPDSTLDVFSPDGHRLIAGAGIVYRFTPRAALLASLEGQFLVPRTNTASDFDLGNGRYTLFLAAATLHGQFKFGRPGEEKRRGRTRAVPPARLTPDSDANDGAEPVDVEPVEAAPVGVEPVPRPTPPPAPPPPPR